ncbi:endonuclease domain-containing protein [Rhizobium sp.]
MRMPHATPPSRHRKFARAMRNDSTKAENMLWQQLRGRQMAGAKFRRQVPLKGYILDFVCFEAMIIIEVDGGQHAESKREEVRDPLFRADGFRVLRFWNEEIERGLDLVCRSILALIKGRGE